MFRQIDYSDGLSRCAECEFFDEYAVYYYNTISEKIEHLDRILCELDVKRDHFQTYCYDYNYIPLPNMKIKELRRNYIKQTNNRKLEKTFHGLDDEAFATAFFQLIQCNDILSMDWKKYLYSEAKKTFLAWCNDNRITPMWQGKPYYGQ